MIAHNLKEYDNNFILRYLVGDCMKPTHIQRTDDNDTGLHVRLVDSLNFLLMLFKKLPKTFSLMAEDEEIEKSDSTFFQQNK